METIRVAEIRKQAEETFAAGLYCAESVVLAMAKAEGIESELLPRIATAFCGGMARTCGPCGALMGGVMGIGLALGRSTSEASVQSAYVATQQLVREFEQAFGARDCQSLLGCDLGTNEGREAFRAQGLSARCAAYTAQAAEMAARAVAQNRAAKPGNCGSALEQGVSAADDSPSKPTERC